MQANNIITNKDKYITKVTKQRERTGAIGKGKKPSTMKRRFDNSTLQYYQALLDPEYAAINSIEVKFPTPYDLPSKCVNIKNSWETKVNSKGNALITWRPNYLATTYWADEVGNWLINNSLDHPQKFQAPDFHYSQVTINNELTLDGERDLLHGADFVEMKQVKLPIIKYRLVSAKLTVEYIGRNDDESGSITSGQWIGDMTPIAAVVQGTTYNNVSIVGTASMLRDNSNQTCAFGQFDNIRDLPYGNVKALRKGDVYSYYYYPIDSSTSKFTVIGQYGESEQAKEDAYIDPTSTGRLKMSISDFAPNLEMTTTVTSTGGSKTTTSVSQGTNRVTVPSYIIAISGLSSTTTANEIRINLYENYECIFAPELSMFASTSNLKLNGIVANQVQQSMLKRVASGIKDTISKPIVANVLKGVVNALGNMSPMTPVGNLGKALVAAGKAFSK